MLCAEDGCAVVEEADRLPSQQHTLENVENMTIKEIKAWLNDRGCHDVVWDLGSSKKTKKADWIQAVRNKME